MPDRVAMKYTAASWQSAVEAWTRHRARCATCRACTCEPPNPAELCDDGAALRAAVAAELAAYHDAVAKPTGWR
jgi:hypothetical protein